MNIKISTLRSVLHDSETFSERSKNFIFEIEKELNNKLQVSSLDDYDCDLKLIFVESGGSEMLFKNALNTLKEPFYFLTSGDNNSLAATLEILTFLNTLGKKGEIIHGDICYIAKRIKELTKTNLSINILNNQRFGVIGKPSDWLIASIPHYSDIKEKFNVEIIDIPLSEVIDDFNNIDVETSESNFDKQELKSAEKVYTILKNIVLKYNLNGLTIRCFDLLDSIKTTGCLALAKLNKEGIIATCEGDVMAMISMAIAKQISMSSSFQANPSRIDTLNNSILFAHCTIPFDMITSFKFMTHFESGIGVAIKGELKEEVVTIFRLSKDLKNYFVSRGKIIKNLSLPNLCRTQIEVKLDEDVKELLTNPCGNHHIIFYGDYVDEIDNIFK